MRVAIVGFPYSGKSTLFTAVSGLPRDHLNLAGENLAAVKVPEPRLDLLEGEFKPKKRTESSIEFVDLPGSLEGEAQKAGLEKHLPTLRQAEALLICLRKFASDAVPAHGGRIDPQNDLAELHDEMLLADLLICDNRIAKLEKAITRPSPDRDKQKQELALLLRCRATLEEERPIREAIQNPAEEKTLRSFGFLTQKPVLVVINVGEGEIGQPPCFEPSGDVPVFAVCAEIESEIMQLEREERAAFMADYGISAMARDRIIRACFDALGLITFLTAGPEEVRAWAIPRGLTAQEAAGKIHTDLARGFIRAETVAHDDLRAAGTWRDAKAANKIRQEPRGYIVQDGDIVTIKFNV